MLIVFCLNGYYTSASITKLEIGGPTNKSCSYTLQESFSYSLPVGVHLNQLSKTDQVKYQNKGFTKKHTFTLDSNREYTHAVDYISSRNLYPEWMSQTTDKILFSESGFTITTKPNRPGTKSKLIEYTYSRFDLETYYAKKESFTNSGLSTKFFTTTEILHFAQQSETAKVYYQPDDIVVVDGDSKITLKNNGNYIISDSNNETAVYVDPLNLLVSINQGLPQGVKKVSAKYMISEEGYLLPESITIKTPVIASSGLCIQEIVKKEYSSYQFEGFKIGEFDLNLDEGALDQIQSMGRNSSKEIQVYPNPVRDILYLTNVPNAKNAKYRIADAQGATIRLEATCIDDSSLSFSLSNLQPGIYFISLLSSDSVDTYKFIKQ